MAVRSVSEHEVTTVLPARRRWRQMVAWPSGYGSIIAVLMALENSLVFQPVAAHDEWLSPPNARVCDVELPIENGCRIHAWWCPVADAKGTVLYCHGNAGNLSHRRDSIARWQELLHQQVLIFDYPGYGKSEGRPSEAGCYQAAQAAYDWLIREQCIRPDTITLYGGSLGGGVAVHLARQVPHRALVLLSAFTSLPDVAQRLYPWLPARWLVRNRFDNLAKISDCEGPVFIAHGDCDSLIPFAHGQRLFAAAREPKEFFCLQHSDHNDPATPEFYERLGWFLTRVAKPKDERR
jgi:fermentation-respiration switch protein FrsA (DUF1100 family)